MLWRLVTTRIWQVPLALNLSESQPQIVIVIERIGSSLAANQRSGRQQATFQLNVSTF